MMCTLFEWSMQKKITKSDGFYLDGRLDQTVIKQKGERKEKKRKRHVCSKLKFITFFLRYLCSHFFVCFFFSLII